MNIPCCRLFLLFSSLKYPSTFQLPLEYIRTKKFKNVLGPSFSSKCLIIQPYLFCFILFFACPCVVMSNSASLLNRWFKLLDKTGKPDKDRGEVLVDIQFMRNSMTASMFDLSAAGKSRSRLGKFKDKVRGKKKESDSASSVVPSFPQVMTDSEDEANGDDDGAARKDGKSKKHKIKSLFSPKSNLQRNMSQSMSVLPAKNSSLSGSQSSGLNVDSSEGQLFSLSLLLSDCVDANFFVCFQVKRNSSL